MEMINSERIHLLLLCVSLVLSVNYTSLSEIIEGQDRGFITPCQGNSRKPARSVCKELCTNGQGFTCHQSGACICDKEPTPSMVGGVFVHCTNWDYVEQKECRTLCVPTGKNDTRVCWTPTLQYYCTCFDSSPPSFQVAFNRFN